MVNQSLTVNVITSQYMNHIEKGLSSNFLESIKNSKNPYGNSNSSSKIINVLKNKNFKNLINKPFVDVEINKKM